LTDPEPPGSAYEQLSYPGYAYTATHPARLEPIGRLFGLDPAPAASCRVLELGCGDGGNALSIAQTLPGAWVLGIDAAAGAVERGSELARAAGLGNVELRQGDFESLSGDGELGSFDYVLAHGVYSWIPPAARVALLSCVRRCLAPHGIAFVSYNAYPGSYLRDMARDVLRYHVRGVEDPQARLAAAHELMQTIVAIEEPTPYARVLREQTERMLRASPALLFHDDLAEVSTPFYFHEFVEHAAGHRLRFLSEANLFESQMRDVPESAERLIVALPDDALVREQYLDFFKNRMFRQTLLCHATMPVRRELDDTQLERCAISSPATVAPVGEPAPDGEETFVTPEGFSMTTSEPLVRGAMHALADAWPAAPSFSSLLARACAAAGEEIPAEVVAGRLRDVLLQAYLARIVHLHGCAPPVSARPEALPCASPLARTQILGGPIVSSLVHANLQLGDELETALLGLLDGTRDAPALAAALGRSQADVEAALARFASVGLLLAPAAA
jgi:SAM-dependent methyltransferase